LNVLYLVAQDNILTERKLYLQNMLFFCI